MELYIDGYNVVFSSPLNLIITVNCLHPILAAWSMWPLYKQRDISITLPSHYTADFFLPMGIMAICVSGLWLSGYMCEWFMCEWLYMWGVYMYELCMCEQFMCEWLCVSGYVWVVHVWVVYVCGCVGMFVCVHMSELVSVVNVSVLYLCRH